MRHLLYHRRSQAGTWRRLPQDDAQQHDPAAACSRACTSDAQPPAADGCAGSRKAKKRKADRRRADAEASTAAAPPAADVLHVFMGLMQQADRYANAVCTTCRQCKTITSHHICCTPSSLPSLSAGCTTGTTKATTAWRQAPRRSWRRGYCMTLRPAPGAGQLPCLCGMGSWHAGGRSSASGWRHLT
jgi:hypothetical protein